MAAKISLGQINSAFSSVAIKSEAGQELAIDGSGYITMTNTSFSVTGLVDVTGSSVSVSGAVSVSATDLDIRDITHATDSIRIGDSLNFLEINNDGSINAIVNNANLDIRDLLHTSDSVKIGDGSDFLAINADGSINVNGSFGSGSSAWKNSLVSLVATTAAELAAVPLSGRTSMTVQNLSNQDIWLGPDNTVTDTGATHGLVLPKGTSMDIPLTETANIFAYANDAADLLVSEFN